MNSITLLTIRLKAELRTIFPTDRFDLRAGVNIIAALTKQLYSNSLVMEA